MRQDEAPHLFYVVDSGELSERVRVDDTGEEYFARDALCAGECFGELALLQDPCGAGHTNPF